MNKLHTVAAALLVSGMLVGPAMAADEHAGHQ